MKYPRLSALFIAISAASLVTVSTASFAGHKYHHKANTIAVHDFKGEANYKAEVPPPCPPILVLHDGFYVGAGVGYDSYRFHHTLIEDAVDIVDPTLNESSTVSLNHSATGWMGGLFAGYGHYFDWFYLGAEINANASNADTSWSANDSDGDSFHATMKARTSYGIALLPGLKVNDSSLLYARVGYLRTDFRFTHTFTNTFEPNFNLSNSSSNWENGFDYGVGIETYVAENVSVRGEFTHTNYRSKTISRTIVDPATGTISFTGTSKFKPSNNEFMLSLLYHFC